ncbi:MAG: hypothetical protein ABL888_04960 [Pirellulaceae bacterium]
MSEPVGSKHSRQVGLAQVHSQDFPLVHDHSQVQITFLNVEDSLEFFGEPNRKF